MLSLNQVFCKNYIIFLCAAQSAAPDLPPKSFSIPKVNADSFAGGIGVAFRGICFLQKTLI